MGVDAYAAELVQLYDATWHVNEDTVSPVADVPNRMTSCPLTTMHLSLSFSLSI